MKKPQSILVIGASGMLGNAVLRYFAEQTDHRVTGSVRSAGAAALLPERHRGALVAGVDVEQPDALIRLFDQVRPDVVINCVGLVKQIGDAGDVLKAAPINAILPHRLARLAAAMDARLIHLSTDCVFAGTRGGYVEGDLPDATDVYGRTKLLGEVDYPNALTLRTSIIGHELGTAHSLIGWFLAQEGAVKGYRRAIFSGLPTVEIARVIHRHVLDAPGLTGLYHLSAAPIDKYSLLKLVAQAYDKRIAITPDDTLVIDRSLDSTCFRAETGYMPPDWQALVAAMRDFG
jgi:dTDP-4-dehydrorhamnose reductase